MIARSIALLAVGRVAEIGGAYVMWEAIEEGRSDGSSAATGLLRTPTTGAPMRKPRGSGGHYAGRRNQE